jgi:hypothetical protein
MPSPAVSAAAKPPCCRLIKAILLAVLLCFSHLQAAWANPTYTVTENLQLTFGIMQIPGGSVTDIISTAGAQSGTGTLLYGGPVAGDYTIKCTGSGTSCTHTMTLSIASGTTCTGLTGLSAWQGNYNNGTNTGALPFSGLASLGNGGTADFKVGATATYTSSVTAGTCTPTFTISITDSTGTYNFTKNAFIGFDAGLALTKNSDINFGTVTANNASTYRMSTAGAVTTVSGSGSYITGATSAGNITIAGSTTDGITISAGGYTANNGVTPSNALCRYGGGALNTCAMAGMAPGAGKTLLVGVDVATNGTQAAGTSAAPTFTISVAYQ